MTETEPLRIFVAGTDTAAGKTFAAALLARMYRHSGVRVGVYKPVASGCIDRDGALVAEDAVKLWQAADQPRTLGEVCPQRFQAPLAPNEAARAEGKTVDRRLLREGARIWESQYEVLLIEGAGGLFSPLADDVLNVDLLRQFAPARLIVVAANRLGAIHQTVATCAAARQYGTEVAGIMLSDTLPDRDRSAATNAGQIRRYCDAPLLCRLEYGATSMPESLIERLS